MKKKLPRIKKEVCSFLSDESGRISKRSLIAISSVVGGVALYGLFSNVIPSVRADGPFQTQITCNHGNSISAGYDPTHCAIKATHNLHTSVSTGYVHMASGCVHTNNCAPLIPDAC